MKPIDDIQILIVKFLAGDISEAENEILQKWLEQDSANRREFDDVQSIWNQSENANDTSVIINVDAEWNKFKKGKFESSSGSSGRIIPLFRSKMMKYAAILIIALMAASIYILTPKYYKSETTPLEVKLNDGSLITLNANSELKVNRFFNWFNRNLELNGEAFFEVAKDSSLPFNINSAKTQITVLGTSFNYNTLGEKPWVAVKSGKVSFRNKQNSDEVILTKGMQAILNNGKMVGGDIENANFDSWKTGIFNFKQTPFKQALSELENFYHVKLELAVPDRFEDCLLTSYFDNEDLESVLEELTLIMHFEIENNHPIYRLKSGNCP